MNKFYLNVAMLVFVGTTNLSQAEPYTLPLQLDYGLIKKAVVSQLFRGEGGGAEVWKDKHRCSFLKLFNPRISGEDGQIKLLNDVQAQMGKSFGGQCIPFLAWEGALETYQKPTISADQSILSIPVTRANAYDKQGRQLGIAQLQNLILKAAAPKLADIKIDLTQSRPDMDRTLQNYLPPEKSAEIKQILDTLKFSAAEANDDGIKVELAFDAPLTKLTQKSEAPLTAAEQKQWQATWQEWDGFLSKTINQAAGETQSQALRATLMEILAESRTAFQAGISAQKSGAADPVRTFFTKTWQKLAPQLKVLAKELPEIEGLRYLTFIAATDVIYQLESLGAPFGLEISSDGLRRLARIVMTGKQEVEKQQI